MTRREQGAELLKQLELLLSNVEVRPKEGQRKLLSVFEQVSGSLLLLIA